MGTDSTAIETSGSSGCNDQGKDGNQIANSTGSHRLVENSVKKSPDGENESENAAEESVEVAGHYVPLSPHVAKSNINSSDELEKPARENSPNTPTGSTSVYEGSHVSGSSVGTLDSSRSLDFSHQRFGNKGDYDIQSESQEPLIDSSANSSALHSTFSRTHSHINSTHSHTHSSFTDQDDTSLSQLSAGAAENCSSVESTQLAHLFKVHSLQEELSHLKSKLNDRDVPLNVIVDDFRRILQEHQQLARDIDTSSAHLNVVKAKCSGNSASRVDKTTRAIGNEVQYIVHVRYV